MDWNAASRKVASLVADHRHAKRRVAEEKAALADSRQRIACAEEAQRIIQAVSQSLQQSAHDQIARIVTRCLGAIFDEPYTFQIRFDRARGKTEAKLLFTRDGLELDDPINEASGGAVNLAAFALRLADLMISRPARRKFLIMDEPFTGVNRGLASRITELLEGLAKEMGIQIVFITQDDGLRCGKVVEL